MESMFYFIVIILLGIIILRLISFPKPNWVKKLEQKRLNRQYKEDLLCNKRKLFYATSCKDEKVTIHILPLTEKDSKEFGEYSIEHEISIEEARDLIASPYYEHKIENGKFVLEILPLEFL